MQMKPAQKTLVKTHMSLNTNLATLPDGSTFVIKDHYQERDATQQDAIAAWYNGNALAGDNQPFSNLFVWNDQVTVAMLNKAIDWTTPPPHGLTGSPTTSEIQLAINNQWWRWDQMLKLGYIDMTDSQVRNGVLQVWGNVGVPNNNSTTSAAIGTELGTLCGKLNARRIELAINSNAVGAKTAWNAAVVVPSGLNGARLLQAPMTGSDVDDLVLNG